VAVLLAQVYRGKVTKDKKVMALAGAVAEVVLVKLAALTEAAKVAMVVQTTLE